MGKRQKRIFQKDISQHSQELLEQKSVQVILRSKAVINGKLTSLTSDEAELQDLRFNKHTLPLHDIEEIIYDVEAPY